MSNTINVNYMTRAYNQYQQKNAAKDQEKEDTRFADSVREKSEASGSIVGNSKIGSVSAKDMTMVEYKQYIYNKISQIPMHPTRAGESISVTISEAGFEAMKNDPEYEAWVLNDLQVGWSQPDKWSGICGGAFSTIAFANNTYASSIDYYYTPATASYSKKLAQTGGWWSDLVDNNPPSGSIDGNYATSVTVHWVSGISYVNASCTTMTQMTLDYLVPFGIIVG